MQVQVQVQEPHYNLQVYNGECLNTPDAVVVAGSNQDVSTIVKAVTQSSTVNTYIEKSANKTSIQLISRPAIC